MSKNHMDLSLTLIFRIVKVVEKQTINCIYATEGLMEIFFATRLFEGTVRVGLI